MMNKFSVLFSVSILSLLLTACSSVLRVGIDTAPLKERDGQKFLELSERYKMIQYEGFGIGWNAEDGFCINPKYNNPRRALWESSYSKPGEMHTILFEVSQLTHYQRKSDIPSLRKYLEHIYRQVPGSKIKLEKLEFTECKFNGEDAIFAYMETYEAGRELYLRECCYFFADPMHRESKIYSVRWSERGKKGSWSREAEKQGKIFFRRFKLLDRGY